MLLVPDVDDLDTALARQAAREQSAACDRVMALLAQAGEIAQQHRVLEEGDLAALVDMQGNLRGHRDRLDDVVGIAQGIADSRAPRRASAAILARVAS